MSAGSRRGAKAGYPSLLREDKDMKARVARYIGSGLLLWLTSALAFGQTALSIPGLPGALNWQNTPHSWNIDSKNVLTISSKLKTDWFVDPFDGTVANSAPILLFTPGSDYVLSARVTVKFASKWDAGALMVMGDDHHWAKLSFEFSPDGQNWQILRTFSLDTELPVRVGFESQSPAGPGAVAEFSTITYIPHRIGNIYK